MRTILTALVLAAVSLTTANARADDAKCAPAVLGRHGRRVERIRRRVAREVVRQRPSRLECGCVQVWRSGHYETVYETVRTPGGFVEVWVPATYRTIRTCYGVRRVIVCAGHFERHWEPGQLRRVSTRVWVAGGYQIEHRCDKAPRGHRKRRR